MATAWWAAASPDTLLLVAGALLYAIAHRRHLGHGARLALPVGLFAAILAVLQIAGRGRADATAVRALTVFFFVAGAARLVAWAKLARRWGPERRGWTAVLYLLVLRHFTKVLFEEAMSVLRARRMSAPKLWGRGGFASLGRACAALLLRAVIRAERFHAALLVGGYER
jgi:hypothetical protein